MLLQLLKAQTILYDADNDGANKGEGNTSRRDVELGDPIKIGRQVHTGPSLSEWRGSLAES